MKVVAITGERECEIVERPVPTPRDNYALVKVLVAPMCTELGEYKRGTPSDCLGHEAAGEVVAVGERARVKVGDRVVVMPQNGCGRCEWCLSGEHIHCPTPRDPPAVCGCTSGRATYAQYVLQQDWLLYPVPDGVSLEHASMACCGLGPTFGAMQVMKVNALDTVLISGLGAVGLGAVINAKVRGARVIGIESHPWRANLAKELGAEWVFDPSDPDLLSKIRDVTGGHGADKSIEASSAEIAPSVLAQATRLMGQLTSVGWGGPIRMSEVVYRGLTIRGQWHWNHLRDGESMARTIRSAQPLLDKFITHQFPMSDVKAAWEFQATGQCGKMLLKPWE